MYPDSEILFPPRCIEQPADLRGPKWQDLVRRVSDLPHNHEDVLAFSLMMIRLGSCFTCDLDSYRASWAAVLVPGAQSVATRRMTARCSSSSTSRWWRSGPSSRSSSRCRCPYCWRRPSRHVRPADVVAPAYAPPHLASLLAPLAPVARRLGWHTFLWLNAVPTLGRDPRTWAFQLTGEESFSPRPAGFCSGPSDGYARFPIQRPTPPLPTSTWCPSA